MTEVGECCLLSFTKERARTPVTSKSVLVANHTYELVAQGTVSNWCTGTSCPPGDPVTTPQPNLGVDALYAYAQWRCPTPQLERQLQVNGKGLDQLAGESGQIPYSPSHSYSVTVTGITGPLTFISETAIREMQDAGINVV